MKYTAEELRKNQDKSDTVPVNIKQDQTELQNMINRHWHREPTEQFEEFESKINKG